MTQPSLTEMMAAWKKVSDDFLKTMGSSFETASKTEQGAAAGQEFEKNYVAARAAMAQAAKTAYGPMIEAVGAVPLSEFQRLADQVHTILLRLDRIDDALAALASPTSAPAPAKRKKAKAREAK